MKRPVTPHPKTHAARKRAVRVALPVVVGPAPVDSAQEPEWPGIEAGPRFGPPSTARNWQTDSERADEHGPCSIETVPGDALEDDSAGFEELIDEDRDDGPLTRDA